jgi:hypothetical protein
MRKVFLVIAAMNLFGISLWATNPKGFHDSFNLGSLASWDRIGAPWSIEENLLTNSDDGQNSFLLKKNFECADFIIESGISMLRSHQLSKGGIAFRVSSELQSSQLNGYFAGITPSTNTIFLSKIVNGNETVLAESTIPDKAYGGYLRVKANGSRIRVYFNNEMKIDITDATFSAGRAGLRIFRAHLESGWIVAVENTDPNQEVINGTHWNYHAFNSDLKDVYTQQAKRSEVFGPTDMIVTNFSVLKNFVDKNFGHINKPYEKAAMLYDWVINNLYYDRDAATRPSRRVLSALPLDVFEKRVTNCTGYATLLASFLNIAGIPAILSGGPTDQRRNMNYEGDHIWVEAFIDGRWRLMDPTFDSFNNFKNNQKVDRPNRNQWRYFDVSISDFSEVHRIDRYFLGNDTPTGDLDTQEDIDARQLNTPKGKTEFLLNNLIKNNGAFYWRCASDIWELAPDTRNQIPDNVVFNAIASSSNNKWALTKAGVSKDGNLLVYIQNEASKRYLVLAGDDKIGTYLKLAEPGQQGTALELVVKDNGSLQVLSPLRGVIMRGGNDANARLQRVSTMYDVLMTRFRFVDAE